MAMCLVDWAKHLGALGILTGTDDEADAFKLLHHIIRLHAAPCPSSSEDEACAVLDSADLDGIAKYIETVKPQNIICMVGAGLSTAAGIPDFRSPGTGLYANLQRYNLPEPEAIFHLDYFRRSPDAFYDLARELWPTGKKYVPTRAHHFLAMLQRRGQLLRCYTQNIDMLEQLAGLPEEKIIAAHGNFARAHTLDGKEVPVQELEAAVFEGIEACRALEQKHGSLVKPDIVFFGESLPSRFHRGIQEDFPKCDLLLVLGTSLAVAPFNTLIRRVPSTCPRALFNREPAGLAEPAVPGGPRVRGGFKFGTDASGKARDVFIGGDCDQKVQEFCDRMAWGAELEQISEESLRSLGFDARSRKLVPAVAGPPAGEQRAQPFERVVVHVEDRVEFSQHEGFISAGGDLLIETMTVTDAMAQAVLLPGCKGFTFEGDPRSGKVEVFFKDKWDLGDRGWTSYRMERKEADTESTAAPSDRSSQAVASSSPRREGEGRPGASPRSWSLSAGASRSRSPRRHALGSGAPGSVPAGLSRGPYLPQEPFDCDETN